MNSTICSIKCRYNFVNNLFIYLLHSYIKRKELQRNAFVKVMNKSICS